MEKKTGLDYKLYGVRGGSPQYRENVGAAVIFADGLTIDVDAFEGTGDTYKIRDQKLFTIKNDGGNILFEGTAMQLVEVLERKTNAK